MTSFNLKPLLFLNTNDQPSLDFTHKKKKERQKRQRRQEREERHDGQKGQDTPDRKEFFTRKLSYCTRFIEVKKTNFLI